MDLGFRRKRLWCPYCPVLLLISSWLFLLFPKTTAPGSATFIQGLGALSVIRLFILVNPSVLGAAIGPSVSENLGGKGKDKWY
jgi:hypothetical protein